MPVATNKLIQQRLNTYQKEMKGGVQVVQPPRYDYDPIARRQPLRFPNGKRVALLLYINVQHFPAELSEVVHALVPGSANVLPDVLNTSWRDYGLRVGIWRLFDLLGASGIRVTAPLNLDVCSEHPQVVEEGNAQGWEWLAMSQHGSRYLTALEQDQERDFIHTIIAGIAESTGQQPKGWLTPCFAESFHTPDILAESGIEYLCDYSCDDQPFPMKVRSGTLLSMPYSIELNDMTAFLSMGLSGAEFGTMIKDQFDMLYREGETNGRILPICLHTFLIGQPFRAKHLNEALGYICSHDHVWLTTAGEINDWYRQYCLPSQNR